LSSQPSARDLIGAERDDIRLVLGSRLERLGMVIRYVAYIVLAQVFLLGAVRGRYRDLAIIGAAVLLHNVFVHIVLWRRRYRLFATPWNFLIHLTEASLVIYFTGADESEFFFLYIFILTGYSVFRRESARILAASVVCLLAYSLVVTVEYLFAGISVAPGIIVVKMTSILVCGWFVATISQLWRKIEDSATARAIALASSEATLRTILDSTVDPILVYDESEAITEVNDTACEFLGMTREEMLGRPFRNLLFDDDSLQERLAEARLQEEYHGEQVFVNVEGLERTVDLHIRTFVRRQRRFFVAIAHDITERKNLQEAMHLANANLARLNRELQQVNELKTGLLTTISQRVRSPLTAILGFLDMLVSDEFGAITPAQRKPLQSCRRTTARVFRLIDEALGAPPTDAPQEKDGIPTHYSH